LEWEDDIRTQNCSQNKIKQQLKNPFFNGCFDHNQNWGLLLSSKQLLWKKKAKLQWFSEFGNM
jgi:hypothetical protein